MSASIPAVKSFTTEDICTLLTSEIKEISEETVASFRNNKINGKVFVTLTESDIKEIGCTLGERKQILSLVTSYKSKEVGIYTKV